MHSPDQHKPSIMSRDEGKDLLDSFLVAADSPNVSLNAESMLRSKRRKNTDNLSYIKNESQIFLLLRDISSFLFMARMKNGKKERQRDDVYVNKLLLLFI